MAPEQLEGREADARTDIWALGCVLFEMVAGRRAFDGDSQAAADRGDRRTSAPRLPRPGGARRRSTGSCASASQKDPARRWQSAADVALRLREIAEAEGPGDERPAIRGRRWPPLATLAGAAAVRPGGRGLRRPAVAAASRPAGRRRPQPDRAARLRRRSSTSARTGSVRRTDRALAEPRRARSSLERQPRRAPATRPCTSATSRRARSTGCPRPRARTSRSSRPTASGSATTRPPRRCSARSRRAAVSASTSQPPGAGLPRREREPDRRVLGGERPDLPGLAVGHRGGIRSVTADGGELKDVTRVERSRESGHRLPCALPGGRALLFTAMPNDFGLVARIEARLAGERSAQGGRRRRGRPPLPAHRPPRLREAGHRDGCSVRPRAARAEAPPVPVIAGVHQALSQSDATANSGAASSRCPRRGCWSTSRRHLYTTHRRSSSSRPPRRRATTGVRPAAVHGRHRFSPDGRQLAFVERATSGLSGCSTSSVRRAAAHPGGGRGLPGL